MPRFDSLPYVGHLTHQASQYLERLVCIAGLTPLTTVCVLAVYIYLTCCRHVHA
ncbi:MAG: hypothetical protein ACC628_11855 [Pirellulaceae bacterium]